MKKRLLAIMAMLFCVLALSCNSKNVDEKYEEYYKYQDSLKGIEIYVWKEEHGFECVLTSGSNRIKSVDEIKKLQDELPCPIDVMKEILKSYKDVNDKTYVALVSNPVKQEELCHLENASDLKENEEFLEVLVKLGIDKDKYKHGILNEDC